MIRLEPVGPQHVDRMQELVADPEVLASTRLPEPYPADGARDFVDAMQRAAARGEAYAFAVIADDAGYVGTCGLHGVDRAAGRVELGYWVGRAFWGRGYASAAVREAVRIAVTELGFDEVVAHALEDNVGSRRVLEKAGFTFLGLGRHDVAKWPADVSIAQYRIRETDLRSAPGLR